MRNSKTKNSTPENRSRPLAWGVWVAVAVLGLAALAFTQAVDTRLLMPGPVSTVHSGISDCKGCHTNVEKGQVGWLHALVKFANPGKDSAACVTCHKMGDAPQSPHGVAATHLKAIADDWLENGKNNDRPGTARIGDIVFRISDAANKKVSCATCHKEHRPDKADLTTMSDNRCQVCHQVQFDSFEKNHPKFDDYPFKRRTRIAFDHSGHFSEHFPETRKKKPDLKTVPVACADCHDATQDKRHMSLKPFSQICSACHLPQIVGAERASGPKGIALLALPGLDLATLKERGADLGDWPAESEADITPLMKLLLGRDADRRQLVEVVDKLDLLDLTSATDNEIVAVERFAWEAKGLIHALTTSKASDVMLNIGQATGSRIDQQLMAKLIATMPRDVLISAQREWLPNLNAEMIGRGDAAWVPKIKRSASGRDNTLDTLIETAKKNHKRNSKGAGVAANEKKSQQDELVKNPKYGAWRVNDYGELVQEGAPSAITQETSSDDDDENNIDDPSDTSSEQDTEQAGARVAKSDEPVTYEIDAEAWAEFGGWYRKDFAVLYKPTGHGDPFVKAWLNFSGYFFANSSGNLAAPVFSLLTGKDAQGQCTKCHSVDAETGGVRKIQWTPSTLAGKAQRFTKFVHEPHFRLLDDRGCLTCHAMDKSKKDVKKAYQSPDPKRGIVNFKPVEKKLCATCHKKDAARRDCMLCHTYHVSPITTPITSTKLPK